MTRHGSFLFGPLHQDGFSVVSSIELRLNDSIDFVLFKVCCFIVYEASAILLSSMLPTFFKLVTDKIAFVFMQRGSLALPTWLLCLCFDSQYGCRDVICIFFVSAQIPWNKTSTIKRMSRRRSLLCLLYQEGCSVDSSIEFYRFCIGLKFGFIVEPSIMLSSPMLPFFFSSKWYQMKFAFVFMLIRRTSLTNMAAVFLLWWPIWLPWCHVYTLHVGTDTSKQN